uniref:Uncharacterized protein n=1 Tax=Cryptosporidium parvum TaxID=5807 RepID=F0X5E1_CRYPV
MIFQTKLKNVKTLEKLRRSPSSELTLHAGKNMFIQNISIISEINME